MKGVARAIAVGCILLGLFLVTRTYRIEREFDRTMPRSRDSASGRIMPELVRHDITVYVTEAESKGLETARVYSTFGWPFAALGVLLGVASRDRRPLGALADAEPPWTERR